MASSSQGRQDLETTGPEPGMPPSRYKQTFFLNTCSRFPAVQTSENLLILGSLPAVFNLLLYVHCQNKRLFVSDIIYMKTTHGGESCLLVRICFNPDRFSLEIVSV